MATYQVYIDTKRDNTFNGANDDISAYVIDASWTNGMMDSYQEVAPPARMTLNLRNNDGAFSLEPRGAELVTNGTFANWTGGNPDGWTVTGEVASNPEVSQVAPDKSHGGSGTGACNLYTTSAAISISQVILTVGSCYELTLRVTKQNGGAVAVYTGTTLVSAYYSVPGTYTIQFTATSTTLKIANLVACDVTIDDVSCKLANKYAMVRRGTLVKVVATVAATPYVLYQGKITSIRPTVGASADPRVVITAEDLMLQMLDAEYAPKLLQNVTTDQVLTALITETVVRYPYAGLFWMLDVQGSSELDYTATIYNPQMSTFDTGVTTHQYVGDAADRGKGVSAQGYVRDIVAAECGGRYWFDSRTGKFIFHNRNRDPSNDTSSASFTESSFDQVTVLYGEDLMNEVTLNYTSRTLGSTGTVLWSNKSVPISLKNNERREYTARYTDPNNDQLRLGAVSIQQPVPDLDYICRQNQDGSGANYNQYLTISAEYGAESAKITVDNHSGYNLWITTLQLRGQPFIWHEETAHSTAPDSIDANDLYPQVREVRALSDASLAQQYADFLVQKFKNPLTRFQSVTFSARRDATMESAMVTRVIGDRITVTESWSSHNRDYIIVGEQHRFVAGGDTTHDVTWILKPQSREIYWKLGTSGKSELDVTTLLAF